MSNGWGEGHLNNSIGWGNSEYSITEVNITSNQIKAIGTTPIDILPSPPTNQYYEWHLRGEFTAGSVAYSDEPLSIQDSANGAFFSSLFSGLLTYISPNKLTFELSSSDCEVGLETSAGALQLTTTSALDPVDGNGTMRIVMTYTLRTFGA